MRGLHRDRLVAHSTGRVVKFPKQRIVLAQGSSVKFHGIIDAKWRSFNRRLLGKITLDEGRQINDGLSPPKVDRPFDIFAGLAFKIWLFYSAQVTPPMTA